FIVVKLTSSGAIDTSFGNAGSALVGPPNSLYSLGALVVQPDGKILVVGGQEHDSVEGITGGEMFIARLTTAGQPDTSFDQDGIAIVSFPLDLTDDSRGTSAAVQFDGKIVVGGLANTSGTGNSGRADPVAIRLTPDGQLDTTFGSRGRMAVSFPD